MPIVNYVDKFRIVQTMTYANTGVSANIKKVKEYMEKNKTKHSFKKCIATIWKSMKMYFQNNIQSDTKRGSKIRLRVNGDNFENLFKQNIFNLVSRY